MIRSSAFCLLIALTGCAEPRGWRGNLAGDYRATSDCAAGLLAPRFGALRTVREDRRVAIVASPAREKDVLYEVRLQETSPMLFFAEVRKGGRGEPALAAWRAVQACAIGGPDKVLPPIEKHELKILAGG